VRISLQDSAGNAGYGEHIMPLQSGDRLGEGYLIERPLGYGGYGEVHLAADLKLRRAVVVKELRPEAAGDPAALERFLRVRPSPWPS
jgi:serine/threonine protein kinase